MKNTILLLSLFALCACSSPAERAQRLAQKATAACADAGYQAGTPAFDNCTNEMQYKEEQRKAARISAADDLSKWR